MKRAKFTAVIAIMLSAIMALFVGCSSTTDDGAKPSGKSQAIILRSESSYELLVGSQVNLVYSTRPAQLSVVCSSSDDGVVTVDRFARVTAVGAGCATVTISLEDNPAENVIVSFVVKRNNFMTQSGYHNGAIDFGKQEEGGDVKINGSQTQLLANACGQNWYFKTHIEHRGYAEGDKYGMWGVGSFLVDAGHSIGDTMFWYILRDSGTVGELSAMYGGWRYATGIMHKETPITQQKFPVANGVDFTIIRRGITHYVIAEFKDANGDSQSFKYVYDVPLFANTDTFPGVFGQQQKLTVSNYSMSNNEQEVLRELAKFQVAESIDFNGLTDLLVVGDYKLTSTVMPLFTIDKSATYALKSAVGGVSLQTDGTLQISSEAVGKSFTAIATAASNSQATKEKTYTVIAKPESDSVLFDTGMNITVKGSSGANARGVQYLSSGTDVTVTARSTESGDAYIPLAHSSANWRLTAKVQSRATSPDGVEMGIMSATGGIMDCVKLAIDYKSADKSDIVFERQGNTPVVFADGADTQGISTLGLIKLGGVYYVEINGKFTKKITVDLDGATMPVLYTIGAGAYFTQVSLTTEVAQIQSYIDGKKYYVGSYAQTLGDNDYKLAAVDIGTSGTESDTLDWPPDNDYANGIKSATSFAGNFQIEFTLSEISPLNLSGRFDAKVLVYLKSERVTSSLQFVIKRESAASPVTCKFTANLDDQTWTTYDLPSDVDIMNGASTIKVVRRSDRVELYINGNRVYESEEFMNNNGFWNEDTVSTPGVGVFLCGARIAGTTFAAID